MKHAKTSSAAPVELGHTVLDVAVRFGYCMGCGVCAAVCPSRVLQMQENRSGELVPTQVKSCPPYCTVCRNVCPMDANEDEDVLGKRLFEAEPGIRHSDLMGWFHESYVGGLSDKKIRLQCPSGGLTTAVLTALLDTGEVDAVIAPVAIDERPWFEPRVLETKEAVLASRGSVYHAVHFADMLDQVLQGPDRRYAIVMLPCMVKGIRLAQDLLPRLRRRLKYVFGLACGSYHSRHFPDLLRGLVGNPHGKMNYRAKRSPSCSTYMLEVLSGQRARRVQGPYQTAKFRGCAMLNACRFCDDIFAELADATFMDAWLPEYVKSKFGTTLALSRRAVLSDQIAAVVKSSGYEGGTIEPVRVEQSQCRTTVVHRKRHLIAARLRLPDLPAFVPSKRAFPSVELTEALHVEALNEQGAHQLGREILARSCPSIARSRGIMARARAWATFARLFRLWKRHYPVMAQARLVDYLPRPGIRSGIRHAARTALHALRLPRDPDRRG